jgi:hypothetical protein
MNQDELNMLRGVKDSLERLLPLCQCHEHEDLPCVVRLQAVLTENVNTLKGMVNRV